MVNACLVSEQPTPTTLTGRGGLLSKAAISSQAAKELDAYGYEVYRGLERLYWYDDFPHPNDPTLVSTYPHHKHIPPDIKHHRVPAPEMSFMRPNLPALIDRNGVLDDAGIE